MALYQVILSMHDGHVHEYDLRAPDAPTAITQAVDQVRTYEPDAVVTNVHARHVAYSTR